MQRSVPRWLQRARVGVERGAAIKHDGYAIAPLVISSPVHAAPAIVVVKSVLDGGGLYEGYEFGILFVVQEVDGGGGRG